MTPQSNFMIVAPIDPRLIERLTKTLGSMNHRPGVVDPLNNLLPFGRFDRLHFARLMILDDPTENDVAVYGVASRKWTTSLIFLGDCDGSATDFLDDLVARAGVGLKTIFSHCAGFTDQTDVRQWMSDRNQSPATIYVNWIGRTVRQVREEDALYHSIESFLDASTDASRSADPRRVRASIVEFVEQECEAGRLTLTPQEVTPPEWQLRNLLHLVGVPIILLVFAPLIVVCLPFVIYELRRLEKRDPVIAPRPDPVHVARLADLEDHDVTNQYNAFGAVKPGLFRRLALAFLLWVVDYTTRHVFNRGYLTRVSTIHFARWVFLADKTRVFFASNYDGGDEAYMDDFINKLGWGLNLVFSNGVGYPQTQWVLHEGTYNEQPFKYFNRRHQLPSDVWYKAYPGLSTIDLERNSLIRAGIEKASMTDAEIRDWLKLF